MTIISNGVEYKLPFRGPSGPDGNPIGTVISYMGLTAPKDYLICDGATYNIDDYPDLAIFFNTQFGSVNYFGGNGTTTFAVPDMRNLFLRGYHGEAEEQLSGDIGEKQEATNHQWVVGVGNSAGRANFGYGSETSTIQGNIPSNFDSKYRPKPLYAIWFSPESGTNIADISNAVENPAYAISYTSRPVNMAVLYCIKAVESVSAENVYSEEETVVGRWIDGKPLYRRVITGTLSGVINHIPIDTSGIEFKNIDGSLVAPISLIPINYDGGDDEYMSHSYVDIGKGRVVVAVSNAYSNLDYIVILTYTKTVD